MLKNITILFLLSIFVFQQTELRAQSDANTKAQWIFQNFPPYVTWKNEESINKFVIGVFGSSSQVYNELVKYSKNSKIKGKSFTVVRFKKVKDITATHILFVESSANEYIKDIYENIMFNTLLITDQCPDKDLYMLNFLPLHQGQKRFVLNSKVASAAGLIVGRELLKYGGSDVELRGMISKTEKELEKERKKLELQRAELAKQIEESEQLKRENRLERQENERQKKVNLQQKTEIENQKNELEEKRLQLSSVQIDLLEQVEKLSSNTKILEKQDSEMKAQEASFLAKQKELEQLGVEIAESKEIIQNKDLTLGERESQIQTQQFVIFGFVVLILLVLFLAYKTWKSAKIRKKINDELRFKNDDINRKNEEILTQQRQTDLLNIELEKLSIVASKTDNAVTILDSKGNFEWVNVGFTRLYGYTLQLLTHELGDNIIEVSSNEEIKGHLERCRKEKQTVVYESLNTTRDGREVWIQTSLTPILDTDKNIRKLITIETNISRIKKAEQEIHAQHEKILEQSKILETTNKELEKLSLVASETDNAITIMDAAGNFQWINEGHSRLYGYSYIQLISEYSRNIITKHTGKEAVALIKKCIEQKVPVTYETPGETRDGKEIWVQTTITPITDNQENVKSLISISSDISKLKDAEQSIRKQSEELIIQKDELVIQNDYIEQQNENIKASITYAKTIQNAILPPYEELSQFFNVFLIYKPKDIVSGDFYWYAHLPAKDGFSEKFFYAAVDCTGHGVPGAFMSMIGSRLLNEIVNERKITKPSQILTHMDLEIKSVLRQEETDNNDGMDVSLCSIEKGTNGSVEMNFAGAKRPLYYYVKSEKSLKYVKGTRKTIGGTQARRNTEEFTDNKLTLHKGDLIYLSTDGLIDQSSPQRIRYGSPRVIELLQLIGEHPLQEQSMAIEKSMLEFQEHEQQRDDITFLGIEV
ncbi:MAG: YfiR/HmsC family protein [Bacteroidota bacterium]